MKLKLREFALALVLSLAILGAIVASNTPANASLGALATTSCGVSGCVSTPPLSSSTSYSYSGTSTVIFTTTTSSFTTSISSSTTTTTATTTSTSWSYTSSQSTTTTTTSYSTSITGTTTSSVTNWITQPTTTTTTSVYTTVATVKGTPVPYCPITYVTGGSPLEPYAMFLRNFRNNAIQNTTAGREFMLTFNTWYYSWAPSLSYSAATNPWTFKAVQVGVYPLIGIFYASYYSYALIAPISAEAGAIIAGIVTASLMGAVYLAPVAYLGSRLIRRHGRLLISKQIAFSSIAWFAASVVLCVIAYATGSGQLLAVGTSSMALSMLSLGSQIGTRALTYIQLPSANIANTVLAFRRLSKLHF